MVYDYYRIPLHALSSAPLQNRHLNELTPSISSITSFRTGAAEGERKPEPSATQPETLEFPTLSASLSGVAGVWGPLGDPELTGTVSTFCCEGSNDS